MPKFHESNKHAREKNSPCLIISSEAEIGQGELDGPTCLDSPPGQVIIQATCTKTTNIYRGHVPSLPSVFERKHQRFYSEPQQVCVDPSIMIFFQNNYTTSFCRKTISQTLCFLFVGKFFGLGFHKPHLINLLRLLCGDLPVQPLSSSICFLRQVKEK